MKAGPSGQRAPPAGRLPVCGLRAGNAGPFAKSAQTAVRHSLFRLAQPADSRQSEAMAFHGTRAFGHGPNADVPTVTSFNKFELNIVLTTYGRMVAAGDWRDYGISHLRHVAVFSVFRHTAEHPIYRIVKQPRLSEQQAKYQIVGMDGRIFRRGNDLARVMRFFEAKLLHVLN